MHTFEEQKAAFFSPQSVLARHWVQVRVVESHLGVAGVELQSLLSLHCTHFAGDTVVRHLFSGLKLQSPATVQGTHVFDAEHLAAVFEVQCVLSRQATQVFVAGLHLGVVPLQSLSSLHCTHFAGDTVVRHLFSGVKWQSPTPVQGTQVFEEHTAAFFALQSVFTRQATQVCEVGLHLGVAGPQSLSVLH